MDFFSTVAGSAAKAGSSLLRILGDRTRIRFVLAGPTVSGDDDVLFVRPNGQLAQFAIGSDRTDGVEICGLELLYSAPTQLFDLDGGKFFKSEASAEPDHPFRLIWEGNCVVRRNLMAVFGVRVNFHVPDEPVAVKIRVRARRKRAGIAGFISTGREQLTSRTVLMTETTEPEIMLRLSPGTSFQPLQPYLVKAAVTASSMAGGRLQVHQIMEDGTTESTQFRWQAPSRSANGPADGDAE